MKLNLAKIKEITLGAVNIKEENSCFYFDRFTNEQKELYKKTNENFYMKTFSTSGIKFSFKTDSKSLFLKIKTQKGSSRTYFSVDVFIDGKILGYLDNFSDKELKRNYTTPEYELGEFKKSFDLGDGEKNICIHLPWSVETIIEEISIDDNSFVEGVKPSKRFIAYGDSITHGYDALRPSNRYVARIAKMLDAEEVNRGIGGEKFFPLLVSKKDSFVPDYITVAYGSNDWNFIDEETFKNNCRNFYLNLVKNYPETTIFAITPIWRKDMNDEKEFGEFKKIEEDIKDIVKEFDNIKLISGFDFVPHDENYFGDLYLHPNDEGFKHYAENLYHKIIESI
ncbi:MAG: SGNH/GDSL hydrolase family protein [Ruminococcaceae bacterium]|nr:SGNH/GDSL hydrolase family protein [Oscillospiraceae bacterium]